MNIDLTQPIKTALEAGRKTFPRHVNRISDMGHQCERYLYHCRADWDKRASIDASLLGIFRQGNTLEPILVSYFNLEIGPRHEPPLRIVGQQATTRDSLLVKYEIEGSSDGFLQWYDGDNWITHAVADIKSAGQNPYRGYYDLESLKKHTWSQRYIAQLMLYSFAHNLENCVIFFIDKSNIFHNWKTVEFVVDFAYVEDLLQKAERINKAVKNTNPNMVDKICRPDICDDCGFKHICMPDMAVGTETKISTDPELVDALNQHLLCKCEVSASNLAEKKLKSMLVKGQNIVVGDKLITWKKVEPKGKAAYFRMKIE